MGPGFGPNATALNAAIRDSFDIDDLEGLIYLVLGQDPDEFAPDAAKSARVLALMQWAQKEGCERVLVDAVADQRGDVLGVASAIESVRKHLDRQDAARWYAAPDPLDTCFVRSDMPFFDRSDLRKHLATIMRGEGRRTLVVRGSSGSGRSYSSHFVAHVVEREEHAIFQLDVETELDPGFGPGDLARTIAYTVGRGQAIDYMPTAPTTSARRNIDLVGWLLSEIDGTHTTWWLLLDGLDKVELRPEAGEFIAQLMRQAEMSERHLRVVLLGVGDVLPPEVEDLACREEIGSIERRNIEEFFQRFAQHMRIDATPEQIAASVEKVLEGAPPDDPERLRAISRNAQAVARVFANAPRNPGT